MLLLLTLVSTATAAPQLYPLYQQGYPIYQHGYPVGYPARAVPSYPGGYPYQPAYQPAYPSGSPTVDSRTFLGIPSLLTWSAKLDVKGNFKKDTTTTPARTVEGTVEIYQNPATGSNSKYNIYINGGNDMANKKYKIAAASSCTATGMDIVEVTAPFILINGFWVSGIADMFNIDGADSKTSLKGMFLTVSDSTGVIGCTDAALA